MKILLVDDEIELVDSLRSNLEAFGYTVLTAHDGKSALEIARDTNPSLILLDLMLPLLDGYRVLKLLKSDERYRGIPIVVITARADLKDITLALECGADGCLVKPLKVELLLKSIQNLLGIGKADGHPID